MPRYYCDYCDTYLTHDSPSVRKQHNSGYKHKANVRIYYQQFEEQQTQSLIDQRIKEHLGQAAAYHQVGGPFNQLLGARPRVPVLPTPLMPMAQVHGAQPYISGMRPPVLPRPPPGAPVYVPGQPMQPMVAPPGAPSMPGQISGFPMHPTVTASPIVPGSSSMPISNGAPSVAPVSVYQANPAAPTGDAQAPSEGDH